MVHHYLHEDPEKQGSHPDLNGQLPHGAAGVAPAAAAGAVRGSHGSAGAALWSLGGEGGALQAAGGGGRRARGGGGGEGSVPASRSGLRDTQIPASSGPTPGHADRRRVRDSLLTCDRCCSSVSWACARRPGPRRGSLGMPRCRRRRLPPGALRGFPAPGRPLGSAPGSTLCRRPLCASSPAGDSCSGSLLFLHAPASGLEVDGRFGDSLALRTALATSGSTWEHFFLSVFWLPYTLPTSDFPFPPLILESSQEIGPNLCFLSEGARLVYKNPDTDPYATTVM